jgi:hypothetical protein
MHIVLVQRLQCHISVDFASKKEFSTYKISLHKKVNIIQEIKKNFRCVITNIFYHRAV